MMHHDVLELDRNDPLAEKRLEFTLPDNVIYLDGNSLGAMPKVANERSVNLMQEQWGKDLVGSWNAHQWIDLPTKVGEKIAPLLGAAPGQVICCDSTSVNLFKLLCSALAMQKNRQIVLSQKDNFPADLYMVQGLSQLGPGKLCELKNCEDTGIEAQLDETVAVLLLTHVNYRSGKLHDIQRLTELAHQKGILVIWDLAHSTGALPLELDKWGVDFAVGCGYKYLNGGPGAPAFVYVAKRHQHATRQPLSGWMGHATPFSFSEDYQAADGVKQFLCGTPPILSMSVLDAALSVFDDVDMHELRTKSVNLTDLFLQLVEHDENLGNLVPISPTEPGHRGSHLAFTHPKAFSICQRLIEQGVIADFRAPDVLRFGFAPLYLRYRDIRDAVYILTEIMVSKTYLEEKYSKVNKVT
jgi:kynureninase